MKNIKKLLLSLVIAFIATISFNVQAATIKEDASSFTSDVYVIGSTKFDSDYVITASRAAIAGGDEAMVQYFVYNNFDFNSSDIKTYYYCALDNSWSEVQENGNGLKELTTTETKKLTENLNLFFVNNEEKTLEISYTDTVDENSIQGFNGTSEKAKVENGKITVPATWVNGFQFTSNGTTVTVELGTIDSEGQLKENVTPSIEKQAELILTMPDEIYANKAFEFTLEIKANDFAGKKLSHKSFSISNAQQIQYFNEETNAWEDINDFILAYKDSILSDKTIKYRAVIDNVGKIFVDGSFNIEDFYLGTHKELDVLINPDAIAMIDDKCYEDLNTAISEAMGREVKLTKDIELNDRLKISNTVILNLNSHTITTTGTNRIQAIDYANLTIKNGNIVGESYALQAQDNAILNVANDVNITTGVYGITIWDKAQINTSANITVTDDGYGISGNGSDFTQNTIINVNGGTISAPNGAALYLPQPGTTNITGGTLTGNTVIGIKAGILNINGGELTATGEKNDPDMISNGFNYTGDVIYVEENPNYNDNIQIDITGGALTSTNGYIIQEYNPTLGTANELSANITGIYSTKNVTDNDKIFYFTEEEKATFEVVENGRNVKYAEASLSTVINGLSNYETLMLLKDIELNDRLNVSSKATLDLNGHTITISGDRTRIAAQDNASLTIRNGNIIGATYALQAQDKAILNVEDSVNVTATTYGITIWDKAQINTSANITVTDDGYGISGNGSDFTQNTIINVNGGTISAPNGAALYLPQPGTTNITGGTLTGNTVIGIKAGILNINGGELTATGEKNDPDMISNGFNYTGDVIYVEENPNYNDNIQIDITGGALTSTNGYIIQEYNPTLGTANELSASITGIHSARQTVPGSTNRFYYE